MTTPRKDRSAPLGLGEMAAVRAISRSLVELREPAREVAYLLHRGVVPHEAILARLDAAVRATKWCTNLGSERSPAGGAGPSSADNGEQQVTP